MSQKGVIVWLAGEARIVLTEDIPGDLKSHFQEEDYVEVIAQEKDWYRQLNSDRVIKRVHTNPGLHQVAGRAWRGNASSERALIVDKDSLSEKHKELYKAVKQSILGASHHQIQDLGTSGPNSLHVLERWAAYNHSQVIEDIPLNLKNKLDTRVAKELR